VRKAVENNFNLMMKTKENEPGASALVHTPAFALV
jgi:hypothetical protein